MNITLLDTPIIVNNSSSVNYTPPSGIKTCLVVLVFHSNTVLLGSKVNDVLFNTTSLTKAANAANVLLTRYETSIYYLLNPNPLEGTISISTTGTSHTYGMCIFTLQGIDQVNPIEDTDSGTGIADITNSLSLSSDKCLAIISGVGNILSDIDTPIGTVSLINMEINNTIDVIGSYIIENTSGDKSYTNEGSYAVQGAQVAIAFKPFVYSPSQIRNFNNKVIGLFSAALEVYNKGFNSISRKYYKVFSRSDKNQFNDSQKASSLTNTYYEE